MEESQVKELYLAFCSGYFNGFVTPLKWNDGPVYMQRTRKPFCSYMEEYYQYNPLFDVPGERWKDWMAEALLMRGLKPE